MGRSFVRFKDYGFWTRDELLLDWLVAALTVIDKMQSPEAWQIEIGMKLDDAITRGFPGGINPKLDVLLTGEDRINFMTGLSKKIGESSTDPKMRRLSELFIDLIEGRLKTTSSSAIDYW